MFARTVKSSLKPLCAVGLVAVVVSTLGGCQRNSFAADIRNQTPQPVGAALSIIDNNGKASTVAQKRIGPGDRAQLAAPRSVPLDWRASIVIDTPGNTAYPATLQLAPGLTVLNVHQQGDGQVGKLSLEEVPRQ